MKILKIILPILVLATIGYFIWTSWDEIEDPRDLPSSDNRYVVRVKKEIDSLKIMPASSFSKSFYKTIQYHIEDYHGQNFFSKIEKQNNQWKEILNKDLFSAYTPKFVNEAIYVFERSEWPRDYLTFIQNEINRLNNSSYLKGGSSVSNDLENLNNVLKRYREINSFIWISNQYNFSDFELSTEFPSLRDKVNTSYEYLRESTANTYVSNCTRLKRRLNRIPNNLFKKHVAYLETKIKMYSGKYRDFDSQKGYNDSLYKPFKKQINTLKNKDYGIPYRPAYRELQDLLSKDNDSAFAYFQLKYTKESKN